MAGALQLVLSELRLASVTCRFSRLLSQSFHESRGLFGDDSGAKVDSQTEVEAKPTLLTANSPGVRELQAQQDRMGNLAHKKLLRLTKAASRKAARKLVREARIKNTTVEKLKELNKRRPEQPVLVEKYLSSVSRPSDKSADLAPIKGGTWRETIFPNLKLNPNRLNSRIPKYMRESDMDKDTAAVEVAESAPFYKGLVRPSEALVVLKDLPEAIEAAPEDSNTVSLKAKSTLEHQLAAVQKMISLDHASQAEKVKFDIARLMQFFQRRDGDSGSPEVQVAILSVKLLNYDRHLANNKKDHLLRIRREKCYHQRRRMLKYLRRVDLEKYVLCCKALGVDPTTVY